MLLSASYSKSNPGFTAGTRIGVSNCHATCGQRNTTTFTSLVYDLNIMTVISVSFQRRRTRQSSSGWKTTARSTGDAANGVTYERETLRLNRRRRKTATLSSPANVWPASALIHHDSSSTSSLVRRKTLQSYVTKAQGIRIRCQIRTSHYSKRYDSFSRVC